MSTEEFCALGALIFLAQATDPWVAKVMSLLFLLAGFGIAAIGAAK